MATVHAFIRAYSLEPESPREAGMYYRGDGSVLSQLAPRMLMTTLNYQLFRGTPPEKYATMFLGCYDGAQRELKYCNAGHLAPILLTEQRRLPASIASGTVVGLFDRAIYEESTVALQPGDIFVAFSDGVTEPEHASVEFGEQRLIDLVQENRHQPLSLIGEAITRAVGEWIGAAEATRRRNRRPSPRPLKQSAKAG